MPDNIDEFLAQMERFKKAEEEDKEENVFANLVAVSKVKSKMKKFLGNIKKDKDKYEKSKEWDGSKHDRCTPGNLLRLERNGYKNSTKRLFILEENKITRHNRELK